MKKIKLNVKYLWFSRSDPVLEILNHFKRNNRKIKKCLKIAIKDISNTLNIYDWNIIIEIRKRGMINECMKYRIRIELKSKINNVYGTLEFADIEEILCKNEGFRAGLLNNFHYTHKENSFYNELVSKKHTILLMLNNFPNHHGNVIDFPIIENKEISYFKDKHEGFLTYIHDNNLYNFEPENNECCLQLFYVCNKIYWGCSYSLPNKTFEEMEFTNVREIKEHDIRTFLRSMIEASVININQDIEEVLTWDIKDIFAMSKLIGY